MKDRIGVGLITCDRPDFYKKSFTSIWSVVEQLDMEYIVVNDGKEKLPQYPIMFYDTKGKEGVAKAKNYALRNLIAKDCEHIFIMEDDIEITNQSIFLKYVGASEATGIKHFNYGLHGNHNSTPDGRSTIRKTVKYPDGTEIDLYPNLLGAFSYYHRSVLDKIGLLDEHFYNALEHVDHTYQAGLNGFTTPFRWFADIHNSSEYLKDIVPDHQQSVIRNDNFQEVFQKGLNTFIQKNSFSVVQGYGPPEKLVSEEECLGEMKRIYKRRNINMVR